MQIWCKIYQSNLDRIEELLAPEIEEGSFSIKKIEGYYILEGGKDLFDRLSEEDIFFFTITYNPQNWVCNEWITPGRPEVTKKEGERILNQYAELLKVDLQQIPEEPGFTTVLVKFLNPESKRFSNIISKSGFTKIFPLDVP